MAHELTPTLALLGHVAWFGWERFNEPRIKFADGSSDQVRPANYDNSWAVSLGAEYQLTETWTLRSGLQLWNAFEDAAPDALVGDLGEEPFDHVEPGGARRGETGARCSQTRPAPAGLFPWI